MIKKLIMAIYKILVWASTQSPKNKEEKELKLVQNQYFI